MSKDINKKIKALLELDDLIETVAATDLGTSYKTKLEYRPVYNNGCCRHHDVVKLIASEHKDKIISLKLSANFYNGGLMVIVDQCKKLLELYSYLENIEQHDYDVYKETLDSYLGEKLTYISDKYKVQFSNTNGTPDTSDKPKQGWTEISVDAKEDELFEGDYDNIFYTAERLGLISIFHGNYERAMQEIDIFLEPFIVKQ